MVAEFTVTSQSPSIEPTGTALPSGYGFRRSPGGTNVTATLRVAFKRSEHVGDEPLQAPAHAVSFHPDCGDAFTVIRLPRGTWNVCWHEPALQVNGELPVTRIVPKPVTVSFSPTVRAFAAEAPDATSKPTRTTPATHRRARMPDMIPRVGRKCKRSAIRSTGQSSQARGSV